LPRFSETTGGHALALRVVVCLVIHGVGPLADGGVDLNIVVSLAWLRNMGVVDRFGGAPQVLHGVLRGLFDVVPDAHYQLLT
jgi:hypothetical protein